ncbi:hypothetical protein WISP_35307 [Willisornis vidua]|uniref:Uncharacterized protein n=1 Tax=Willisornis vidua TaxID=1566151 RepID=A0ABQ9DLP6_9PASS|nr:hypothetical protein WISP_35307 [Willisornis vidua]
MATAKNKSHVTANLMLCPYGNLENGIKSNEENMLSWKITKQSSQSGLQKCFSFALEQNFPQGNNNSRSSSVKAPFHFPPPAKQLIYSKYYIERFPCISLQVIEYYKCVFEPETLYESVTQNVIALLLTSIYLDIYRAFETASHNILLSKLEIHGFDGQTTQWIMNGWMVHTELPLMATTWLDVQAVSSDESHSLEMGIEIISV